MNATVWNFRPGQDTLIAMYLEDVKKDRSWKRLPACRRKQTGHYSEKRIDRGVGKGRSVATGSMMGMMQSMMRHLRQSGAIRAHQLFEFYGNMKLYAYDRVPQSKDILSFQMREGGSALTDDSSSGHVACYGAEEEKADIVKSMGSDRISFHTDRSLW
jgi:hypothetical protein